MRRLFILLLLLAATQAHPRDIYFKARGGKWRPLPAQVTAAGLISFTLDPAQLNAGATTIVLDLPRGLDLDDDTPPALLGLKLDGQPLGKAPRLDLDWLSVHPQTLLLALRDAANPLDQASLRLEVNGLPVAGTLLQASFDADGRALRLHASLGGLLRDQGRFVNTISFRIADRSPQQNALVRTLTYRCLPQVTESPLLVVDSCHRGYEDLKLMTDGKVMTPGETTYGSTWASEEEAGDHWVVFAWPEERQLAEVKVYWANYSGVFHAPQELLVQAWNVTGWVTLQTLRALKADESTTITLGTVATSRLRLLQPDGKGHPVRPNIMWISEIAMR